MNRITVVLILNILIILDGYFFNTYSALMFALNWGSIFILGIEYIEQLDEEKSE